jgi:hypothetical protein
MAADAHGRSARVEIIFIQARTLNSTAPIRPYACAPG